MASLRKHPFLLALRCWGRFARNLPSSEERGETDVFAGYSMALLYFWPPVWKAYCSFKENGMHIIRDWIFRQRSCQAVTSYFTFVPSKVLCTSKNIRKFQTYQNSMVVMILLIVRVVYRWISTNTSTQGPLSCLCGQPIKSNARSSQFDL